MYFRALIFFAIASKTPKDMNFTLMFVYLAFFAYLFYPAMFYEMNKISLLSPVTSMIEFSKENINLQTFILMLSPPVFAGIIFILISMRMFKYDILFTVQKLRDKILQGIEVFSLAELNAAFFYADSFSCNILYFRVSVAVVFFSILFFPHF